MANDSPAWVLFTLISFGVSLVMMVAGIAMIDANDWMKGYMAMSSVLLINSTFILAKTLRDQHEGKKLHHRLDEAKTEKLLKDYDVVA